MASARQFGVEAAVRYNKLILAALTAVGASPGLAGSKPVPRLQNVRMFPLRLAGRFTALDDRVSRPRHLVIYRVASDGVVEVLSLVHDRMDLTRAARRAMRAASGQTLQSR